MIRLQEQLGFNSDYMKKYFKEFKEFAIKGNVVDLAVAVVIGGAFGKIVSSLVSDIIMPLIGFLIAGLDFTVWKIVLREAVVGLDGQVLKPEIILKSGIFLQNIFDFIIIALSIFLFVKIISQLKKKLAEESVVKKEDKKAPAPLTKDQEILIEIRDLLKNKKDE